ncbi:MAG TPA: transketolase [Spirochaetia bacterium]|nr:transketolase [Spirochaetia bacterium]
MTKDALKAVAASIRSLSIDAVEAANSGHPGLPMGIAELGGLIYGDILKHNPKAPQWINRDRMILSAGHGSMLLYSLLYLCGYGLTLENIKTFRQVGSPAAGHPEYGFAAGIETTTGPLGQGLANAVGFAIAETMLAARMNTATHKVIDHFTYVIAGDGDLMEGISAEASSLAGHLGLGKLIVFYDSNDISLDGSTSMSFTEDVLMRYRGYGWQTLETSAYDAEKILEMVREAQKETTKPTIIRVRSIIGKGAPTKQGTAKSHGSALGAEEAAGAKKALGIPLDKPFWVDPAAESYFKEKQKDWVEGYAKWQKTFADWGAANPERKAEWDILFADGPVNLDKAVLPTYAVGDKVATRSASGKALNAIAAVVPGLVGGSADLATSNNTAMPAYPDYAIEERAGRTLHYGVREHAMGAIMSGITLHGGLRAFGATFLVFSDYLRPAIRLAAIMKLPNIYIMTHDTIYLGEDGTTHQPIEQINSLRLVPGLELLRPGDAEETTVAWLMTMKRTNGPTMLVLTRQSIAVYRKDDADWQNTMKRGAYVVRDSAGTPEVVIVAAGSEVSLALKALDSLGGKRVRVVSMVSRQLFLSQDRGFRDKILPPGVRVVAVEAGVTSGWEGIASTPEDIMGINRFGESGKGPEVAESFGFTAAALVDLVGK